MISLDLAICLQKAGVKWSPAAGDAFAIPNREMDHEVFVLSNMTIETHRFQTGTVFKFNGTTEWALDSVQQRDSVWLPSEAQLRDLLQGMFIRLERHDEQFRVTTEVNGRERSVEHTDPAEAYGMALLDLLEG